MATAKGRTPRTPKKARADWAERFFAALRETRMVTKACELAEVGRSTVYDRRNNDEAFRDEWDEIEYQVTEALEREAFRRAAVGVEKAIYYQGEPVGRERQFSDTLLIFLLKARRPGVYRENVKVEHTGEGGGPIAHADTSSLDPESRELIGELLRRRAGLR